MTYSPIINTAGTVPDPATAPGAAGVTPGAAAAAPHSAAQVPASALPDPASAAPAPGTGKPAEPSYPYSTTGSAGAVGSATDPAGPATGAAGSGAAAYATDAAGYPADAADYPTDAGQADDAAQGADAGTAWPHQSYLELGALPTAAPCARMHTTLVLWEWQLGSLVHAAGLVVSELVSNAVQASAGLTGSRFAGQWSPGTPPVRMWLSADDHRVVIQIWDGSDRPPVPRPVQPEADSGRGLLLVGSLSAEWGCYTPEKSSGKVVWAVVSC